MLKVVNNVIDLIGETPMIKINKLVDNKSASIYAKLEWYNISGSVKDRMALYLIEYAEAMGKLSKEKIILEATSGNTGIALSLIAASKGYRIQIVMPESVSTPFLVDLFHTPGLCTFGHEHYTVPLECLLSPLQ